MRFGGATGRTPQDRAQHYRDSLAETAERPLYARAASDNVGSLRVLEKAGLGRVGVNRDFAHGRGEEIEETILRLD